MDTSPALRDIGIGGSGRLLAVTYSLRRRRARGLQSQRASGFVRRHGGGRRGPRGRHGRCRACRRAGRLRGSWWRPVGCECESCPWCLCPLWRATGRQVGCCGDCNGGGGRVCAAADEVYVRCNALSPRGTSSVFVSPRCRGKRGLGRCCCFQCSGAEEACAPRAT